MDQEFFTSLVEAVAAFLGESVAAGPTTDQIPAPFTSAIKHLADKPVTFSLPENTGIAGIRDTDPEFTLDGFLVHVGEMFAAYHEALDKGDLAPVRRFVDEAAYPALEEAARKTGRRAAGVRALRIRAIRPTTAKHNDGFDLIRVFITADQPDTPQALCEYWEVYRKRGVHTKPGLTVTKCPNCGGPVDGLDPTRCAYCQTRLADPALDWVVRKITPQ